VRHHLQECPCRFDVVSIHFDAGTPDIEIIQNAFDA
jgi:Holliday junction resolvase-like predicted endonuclease